MFKLLHQKRDSTYTNTKVEYFPGFTRFAVADVPVFREPGWEPEHPRVLSRKPKEKDSQPEGRSVSRAKRKIFDIAALNGFQYFVTLTLNGAKIDRTAPDEVAHKTKTWLANKVRRNDLAYLIVPEYHSDGKGIHLHGLLSGRLGLTDSHHHTKDGKTVYNIDDWKYGFSTCVELVGDMEAIARYISKYVTKDTRKIFGNFYYAGGDIRRTPEREYVNLLYDDIDAPAYFVPELGVSFKYLTVKGVTA